MSSMQLAAQGAVFNVSAYGAKLDGTTDDSAAIQAAINAASAYATATGRGGGTVLIPGRAAIASGVTVSAPNVHIAGLGADMFHNPPSTWNPASELIWTGASGGAMLTFAPAAGAANLGGVSVSDLAINGQDNAGKGLVLDTVWFSTFQRVAVAGCTIFGIELTATVSVADVGGCQGNFFSQININAAGPMDGDALYLFEASHNTFDTLQVSYYNGHGINVDFADFNNFRNVRGFNPAGSGHGVLLGGGTAYSNRFYDLSPGNGGMRAYAGAFALVFAYDSVDNSPPAPVADPAGPNVSTTIPTGFSAGVRTVSPASMTNIAVGSSLAIGGTEDVIVTAVTASTFTARFRFDHGNGSAVVGSQPARIAWISDYGDLNGFYTAGLTFERGFTRQGDPVIVAPDQPTIVSDGAGVTGLIINVPTGSSFGTRFMVNGTTVAANITASGDVIAGKRLLSVDGVFPGVPGGYGGVTAGFYSGVGVPAFSATNGSQFLRYDGGTGARRYVNTSGANTSGTTWTAIAGE